MTNRQKVAAAGIESDGTVQTAIKDTETDEVMQKVTGRQTSTDVGLDLDSTVQNENKNSGKKREKLQNSKRGLSEEEKAKAEVKQKKKEDEAMRLDAKNKQLEAIILERREEVESEYTVDLSHTNKNILPLESGIEYPGQQLQQGTSYHDMTYQGTSYQGGAFQGTSYQGGQSWPGSQFGSEFSDFQRYTYVGDLMSPTSSNTAFHEVQSQRELQDKCDRLEAENKQLKKENEQLRQELERSSYCQKNDILTPRKVECLRDIVSSFEEKTRSRQAEKPKVFKPTPLRLAFDETESSTCTPKRPASEASHWEECVTSSGIKKIRLVPELEVYLSQAQLSQVRHSGSENPRKMTVALLDALFSREQLAQSSAKGSRKAYNASLKTDPLPAVTVQAIKQFVLNSFKKDSGEPCLSEPAFNDIINSKCATARRSLKQ